MTTVFHARPYGRSIEIKSNPRRKKLHRAKQNSNFLGGSFSNKDDIRAPIQIRREKQSQHLKGWFFLKNRPIHFQINSTIVIGLLGKQNKLNRMELNYWMDILKNYWIILLCYWYIYLASTYTIHYPQDTFVQELLHIWYMYMIHRITHCGRIKYFNITEIKLVTHYYNKASSSYLYFLIRI